MSNDGVNLADLEQLRTILSGLNKRFFEVLLIWSADPLKETQGELRVGSPIVIVG